MKTRTAVRKTLEDGTPRTIQQIISELPEIVDQNKGRDELLLLLRLDPRLRQLDGERWVMVGTVADNQQRIIELAQQYLDSLPGSGGLLSSLVNHVVTESRYTRQTVEAVVASHFQIKGQAVMNPRKATT